MKNEQKFARNLLKLSVLAALPLIAAQSAFAATSTTGILVDGTGSAIVSGGSQTSSNADSIGGSGTNASGAAVWIEGVGNTYNNSGTISRSSTSGATYGVYLGDYSTLRGSSDNKAIVGADANAGAYGSTTMRITIPAAAGTNGLNATGLVGKQLVMAGVVIDGEAQAGDTRTIRSAVAVSGQTNQFDIVVDKPWARTDALGQPISQVNNTYNLIAGSGLNIFNNSGTVSATYTGTATANIRGFETNVAGDYVINNSSTGIIKGEHTSVGTPQGIDAGGDVTTMEVNNAGLITSIRTNGTITLTSNKLNELKGTAGGITNQSIGSAAAIYSQEELVAITINNTGNIIGVGNFNPGIYMRAGEQTVVNSGTISGSRLGSSGSYTYEMGIGAVSDGGEIRTLQLSNTEAGVINGAVLGVNANAYRWYALSNFGDGGAVNIDNRLQTNNSNWGQLDSIIENEGEINGKVYLSNGTHAITNTGAMSGGIDLDQRDTLNIRLTATSAGYAPGELGENTIQTAIIQVVNVQGSTTQTNNLYNKAFVAGQYDTDVNGLTATSSATATITAPSASTTTYGGLFTVVGSKSFTFENAGDFTGDILIHTASSTALGHTVTSEVTLSPYITGAGSSTANTASFANIHGFDGDLIVVSTSAAGGEVDDVTLAPKALSGTVIKDGEFYKVANSLKVGTTLAGATALVAGNTDLPSVQGNGLVNWTPSINGAGALVLESEVSAANVAGISTQGVSALNALMSANSLLGSQVQNLSDEAAVLKASNQIRPEINGATTQASMNVTDKVFGLVGSRLDEIHLASVAGRSGVATGNETRTADGTGVWMQAFGAKGNQDRRNGTDGYNTNAYGFAIGADQLIDDETRVGFVGSYGESTVNGLGDGTGNRTSIDTYQGAIYGSTMLRKLYLNATLGLGYHDYANNRLVLDNGIKGTYDAWQYSGKLDAGYPIKMNAVTLVPVASLAYSRLSQNGYTETGVGALAIGSRDIDSFRSGLGAKALLPLFDSTVSAGLELRALWHHEFADASIDSTARFVDGGASFTTKGIGLERDSASLGGSFRLYGVMDGVKQSLNVNYDAEVKSQYINQTASLQARFDF